MKKLNIWLIRVGETLPIDQGNPRLFRMGLLAEIFCNRGHQVTWWASTLNHFSKDFRFTSDMDVKYSDNLLIKLLHGCGYTKNMSFKRLKHYYIEQKRFAALASKEECPDIIIASIPTIELAYEAVRYANKNQIPIFIDIRDTFPDMYVDFCNPKIRPLMKVGIIPYRVELAWTLRHATGIFATSDMFLAWALKYASRPRNQNDQVYYVSYPDTLHQHTDADINRWYDKGLTNQDFICCFFGQFGFTVDIDTILEVSRDLADTHPTIKFVICGVGEKLDSYRDLVRDSNNILFPGWVGRNEICALGKLSSVGLMAYKPGKNYEMSMPNKFCEYLALGVALLLQPTGIMNTIIKSHDCGLHYENAQELKDAILELYKFPDHLKQMKENARNLYEQSFCSDVVYTREAEYLESFVANYEGN